MHEKLIKLKDIFGVIDVPYHGVTYILPNGQFLNLKNKRLPFGIKRLWLKDTYMMNVLRCVKCDSLKHDIKLPNYPVSKEQYIALFNWLNEHMNVSRTISISTVGKFTKGKIKYIHNFTSDDVILKIGNYYTTDTL